MTTGQKWAIGGTLLGVIAAGTEVLYIHHQRSVALAPAAPVAEGKVDPDDLVFLKKERPSDLADLKELDGTTVWMSAGGQMEYYPYAAHHADYAKSAGTLLGAEPLVIKDVFEQVAPKTAADRIPLGDKQVLLVFTMPKSGDPAKEYAFPVGYKKGKDYTFYTDDMLFYVDPHQLYNYWGPQIWQAIDAHQVIKGMTEREVQLSLGQIFQSGSEDYGNRTSTYYNLGKPIDVTFEKNRVTSFRADPAQ